MNHVNGLFLLTLLFFFASCSSSKVTVTIPEQQKAELEESPFERNEAKIQNQSAVGIEVVVLDKETDQQISGFGLDKRANAKVYLGGNEKLVLANSSNEAVKATVSYKEAKPVAAPKPKVAASKKAENRVQFTLENKTLQSIPLIIPGVMNPNLSPFSRSGVDLKMGQRILFSENGKRHLLLTVDETVEEGAVVDVAALLQAKRKELGLK